MQYRIDRLNNIYIRLNDDGSTDFIQIDKQGFTIRHKNNMLSYSLTYNNYSHSNKREFDEAEKLARI